MNFSMPNPLRSRLALLPLLLMSLAGAALAQLASPSIQPFMESPLYPFVNEPSSFQFTCVACPGTYTFTSSGQLPPGLTLNPSTGLLSGVATAPNSFSTFTISAVNPAGNVIATTGYVAIEDYRLAFTTNSPLPAATSGVPFTRTINTNVRVSWDTGSSNLPQSVQLNIPFGAPATLSGVVNTQTAQVYVFTLYASYPYTELPGYYNFQTLSRDYVIQVNPPPVLTGSFSNGTVGNLYTAALNGSGGTGPYVYAITGLPPGLSLNTTNGIISGTPLSAGSFDLTGRVTDVNGAVATTTYTLVIAPPPALTISTTTLPDGTTGTLYNASLTVAGGLLPYAFSISAGALPDGLTISNVGSISGTPTKVGTFNFTVSAADRQPVSVTKALSIVIRAPLAISTATLPNGSVSNLYSAKIAATGGVPPYVFRLQAGALPAGLTLATDGTLSGTPTTAAVSTFTVRVFDSLQRTADQPYTVAIVAGPTVTTTSLPGGTVGVDYSTTLAGQGVTPLSWSISAGSLPPGLAISPAGAITGKPSLAGTYPFTVQALDSNQPALAATRALSITVVLPPLPSVSVVNVTDTQPPASQPSPGVSISQSFPVALDGTANLSFTPDAGPIDPSIRFSNGKTSVDFGIPAGQTAGIVPNNGNFAFQTGTTAGVITLAVTLRQGGQVLQPNPAVTRTIRINKAAPTISSVTINRNTNGFDVLITGFTNTREITTAVFKFTPTAGSTLTTTDVPVTVNNVFQNWFSSAPSNELGGQFLLTVPFTLTQGAISTLASVQVTLTNTVGSSSGSANF